MSTELEELYQEVILDHSRRPRNFGVLEKPDVLVHGDTHVEQVEEMRGVLLLNPGSPTFPRNLTRRPGTIAFLECTPNASPHAWIHQLETADG